MAETVFAKVCSLLPASYCAAPTAPSQVQIVSRPSSKWYQSSTSTEGGCSVTNSGDWLSQTEDLVSDLRGHRFQGRSIAEAPSRTKTLQMTACLLSWPPPLVRLCSTCHLMAGSVVTAQIVLGDRNPWQRFYHRTSCGPELRH